MPISSQGTTFSFPGIIASYTSVQVEEPEMEVVDMTPWTGDWVAGQGRKRLVATGDMKSPGRVTVDYLREPGSRVPLEMRGLYGDLLMAVPDGPGRREVIILRKAYVESATTEVAAGDMIRGQITFVIDHTYD